MSKYKFVNSFDEKTKPVCDVPDIHFYQLAAFADLKTKLYHVRRFTINSTNEFVGVSDHYVNKRTFDKILKRKKNNEYKVFSVYNLNSVEYPSLSDILLLKSDILSTNYDYYGYAPVNYSF